MKNILIAAMLFFVGLTTKAQFGGQTGLGSVWHYPGQYGAGLEVKKSTLGWNYSLSGTRYIKNNTYLKANIFYDEGFVNRINTKSYGINTIYFFSPFSIAETVFFNVGAGITANYDKVSNYWPTTTNRFNYGAIGSFEVEAAIADYIMITGTANQRFLKNETFGRSRYEVGLGIKYLIN